MPNNVGINHLQRKNPISADINFCTDNIALRIHSSNIPIIQNEKAEYPEVHAHHYEEFHYIFSGSNTLIFDGNKPDLILNEGDFCLIPSGVYHCRVSNNASKVVFAVEIDSGTLLRNGKDSYSRLRAVLNANRFPMVFRDPKITELMLQLKELIEGNNSLKQAQISTVLINAVLYVLNELCESDVPTDANMSGKQRSELDDKRRVIIENHINDSFSSKDGLKTLATKLYLSERRTSEIVREIMGESFKELVVKERMTVASILIKSKKYQLEKIASMIGYNSYSGFYTAYKKFFDRPPTDDVV